MNDRTQEVMRLWTLAQPAVSAYVVSVVRDFSARDDVLQETAVAVLNSFERYDPQRPFVAWAMGIAQNQVRLYLRRCHRDRLVFDDNVQASLAESFEAMAADEMHAMGFLRECLKQLEGTARELCELRYTRDMKPAAIAEVVGLNANTVAKSLQRIRDQLRACVDRKSALAGELT